MSSKSEPRRTVGAPRGWADSPKLRIAISTIAIRNCLTAFSDRTDIFANIRTHVLDSQSTLRREPQLLLMEELREPRDYFSILRAAPALAP